MPPLSRNGWVQPVEGTPGGIPIPVSGGGVPANRSNFATNQKAVPTAGTAVQLQSQAVPDGFTIFIRALVENTGKIWVGDSQANAQNHAVAEPLEAGAFNTIALTNTNEIWIDADVNGEGVSWLVEV
jgi:hypothetical protein